MRTIFKIICGVISAFTVCTPLCNEKSIDLNMGLAPSKSILGMSYREGLNEVNLGLKSLSYSGRDGYNIQPGISFNRYLTANGFYGSATYVPIYRNEIVNKLKFIGPDSSDYSIVSHREKGWESGIVMLGIGKTFQFQSWGINLDANLATPASSKILNEWGYWIGAGLSYRFNLD